MSQKTITTCDMCGKEQEDVPINSQQIWMRLLVNYNLGYGSLSEAGERDLCPGCSEKFKAMMKAKEKRDGQGA